MTDFRGESSGYCHCNKGGKCGELIGSSVNADIPVCHEVTDEDCVRIRENYGPGPNQKNPESVCRKTADMAKTKFCRFEGKVFETDDAGEENTDNKASAETVDGVADEDCHYLDEDAGKFAESVSNVIYANVTETINPIVNCVTKKGSGKGGYDPGNQVVSLKVDEVGTER